MHINGQHHLILEETESLVCVMAAFASINLICHMIASHVIKNAFDLVREFVQVVSVFDPPPSPVQGFPVQCHILTFIFWLPVSSCSFQLVEA
jgi:hypothetical protein